MNSGAVLTHYIVAALWSSVDDQGEPLDNNYNQEDLAPQTLEKMKEDVEKFIRDAKDPIIESGMSEADLGHNFWLTREGHGTGFWDRGLEKNVSDAFCKICDAFGPCNLYVGDDNKIYIG